MAPQTLSKLAVSYILETCFPSAPCFYNSLFYGVLVLLLTCPFITQAGDSALTRAAWRGRTDIVVELANAGASINLQNNVMKNVDIALLRHVLFVTQDGDSALMTAAKNGHTNVVVELVKAGAKLDLQNKVCII